MFEIEKVKMHVRSYFNDWTPYKIAKQAGISEASARKIQRDDWNPTAKTLRALETLINDGQDAAA